MHQCAPCCGVVVARWNRGGRADVWARSSLLRVSTYVCEDEAIGRRKGIDQVGKKKSDKLNFDSARVRGASVAVSS